MDKFSKYKPKLDRDTSPQDVRVHKFQTVGKPDVKAFEYAPISEQGKGQYESVKAKFGALAATDPDRAAKSRKDARFSINPLLRDPLAVEEEERRVIEERVRARVTAVEDEAKAAAAAVGYEEGMNRGYEEAYRRFQEEGKDRALKLAAFLEACETAKQEIFKANERFLIELVFRVARMVVMRELKTDKEYALRLASELIERVGVRDNVKLKIHPEDLASAGMLKDGLEKSMGSLKNLTIEPSADIDRGGCQVETEWNVIDASIESQLKAIREALTGARR